MRTINYYSAVAQQRKQEFGDFYLTLEYSGATVPAELSLEVIFSSCPQPLSDDFSQDSEFKTRFSRTVEHLNERYALLRSCGLKPQDWLNSDVSMPQLRQLKDLRELAEKTESWIDNRHEMAYREAFTRLLMKSTKKKKTVARFASFEQWASSEVGKAMLSLRSADNETNRRALLHPQLRRRR